MAVSLLPLLELGSTYMSSLCGIVSRGLLGIIIMVSQVKAYYVPSSSTISIQNQILSWCFTFANSYLTLFLIVKEALLELVDV